MVARALVLPNGSVGEVALGSSCGLPKLDALAFEQVKMRWRFLPALSHGLPVADWITVEVMFKGS